jgi:hypothetical protein
VVPAGYTRVIAWSTNAAAGAGQMLEFKVLRPAGASMYLVVGHDGPRALTPSSLNTFAVDIPVRAGDIIGLNDVNASSVPNACVFATSNAGDRIDESAGNAADGTTWSAGDSATMTRLNVTATLAAPAKVASLSPATGPITGGTTVVISGHDFTGASAVWFGGTKATSFRIKSDTQVTATAPRRSTPGTVDVSVTSPGGPSARTTADRYTYTACVVPKLKGKTLQRARTALTRADCRLGDVKGPRRGRVDKQNPKPGAVLAPGGKVNVTLG